MERGSEEETAPDEEDGDQAACWIMKPGRSEDEGVEVTSACNLPRTASKGGVPDPCTDMLDLRLWRGLVFQDQEEPETGPVISSGVVSEEVVEPERDAPSASPCSLMDTCGPSISSLSSSCSSTHHHHHPNFSSSSSSSSSVLSLTPPLPPSVELPAVLTDTRLTLDVYLRGAAALPLLWGSVPEQLRGLRYLRLGSEDKSALDDALDVLPHLTELRSLAIRGTFLINFMWYQLLVSIDHSHSFTALPYKSRYSKYCVNTL